MVKTSQWFEADAILRAYAEDDNTCDNTGNTVKMTA